MEKLNSLTSVQRAYLGFQTPFGKSDVVMVPVPYDSTTTYGAGTRSGPSAIIDCSSQLELFDIGLGCNICDKVSVHTLDELAINKSAPEKTLKNVEDAVSEILKSGKKPVILGGEHSITAGAVKGLGKKVSVLQIDAHADLRDSYEGTKYSHASVMRRVREISDNVIQVGIRSMSDEEGQFIKENNLNDSIFYAEDIIRNKKNTVINPEDVERIVSRLGDDVYITIDIDGFDPSLVPGTGTPEPGGLLWEDVIEIMKAVSKRNIVGFDIVEVAPVPNIRTSEFVAAKLCYKMMGYFWV